jgi:hypothetical protein
VLFSMFDISIFLKQVRLQFLLFLPNCG